MKKINRKGFTLIELLAVIVIMAIIVVVTVPTIINTISDARVNSLWNLAVATANSYDTMAAQEMIATDKVLTEFGINSSWTCLRKTNSKGQSLAEILGISSTDVFISGTQAQIPSDMDLTKIKSLGACSAIRLKENGSAEVLLIANSSSGSSKFAISGKIVYALSSADKGGTNDVA